MHLKRFVASVFAAVYTTSMLSNPQTVVGAGQAPGPKKSGVVRIGIVIPKTDMGEPSPLSSGEAIRAAERQFLAGPKFESIAINALLPAQVWEQAKTLDCDYVLTSTITQKVKKSGFGALRTVNALSPIAGMIPKTGMAGAVATMNAASAAQRAASVAENASAVKARAEVTFEFNFSSIAGSTVLAESQKAKAKADGEDVITPLIQEAATHIVASVTK